MPEFFMADVRRRATPDLNLTPQAIPQRQEIPVDIDGAAKFAPIFGAADGEIPDDPVPCGIPGCDGITMEWTSESSTGQIDFYGSGAAQDEPERFLSLYILSGTNPENDRRVLKQLEPYADFAQCLNFPLVLQVTDDPLAAAWQHQSLQALRLGIPPLVSAFLKVYFTVPASERSV